MISPKSRQHKEKKVSYRRREHKNKKFYNSKAWRDNREAYMKYYQGEIFRDIAKYRWRGESLKAHQVGYLLSLSFLPCETCLRLYVAEAYKKVSDGKELDHIEPVNPENALDRVQSYEAVKTTLYSSFDTMLDDGEIISKYGDPFSFDNLQLLCKRHHAKKSQRER